MYKLEVEASMDSRLKVIKIITVSAVILIFLLAISLVINLVKLGNMRSKEKQLIAHNAALDKKIAQNADYIDILESEEYLDWYAREYLNMKGRNEDAFTSKEK